MSVRGERVIRITLAVVAFAAIAACGTRLPDEAFVEARQGNSSDELAAGSDSSTGGGASSGSSTATTVAGSSSGSSSSGSAGGGSTGGGDSTGTGGGSGSTSAGPNQASDVGVTETTLRIGTIVAENGLLGNVFQPAATGLRSWVEYINAQGGIAGRTLELFTCDDREDRARTLECARQLVEQDQVFALIATNTRSMGGAAQYLYERGIPVLGNPINNSFYRFPNFFSLYGAPYNRDGTEVAHNNQLASYSTVARWFAQNLNATTAAVFAYDIPESAQAGNFIEQGLRLEGYQVDRYTVSFAAPSFDAAVAEMQRKGTQLVFDAMDTGANIRLCDAINRRQFTIVAKVSTIPVMGETFGEKFNDACRNVTYIAGDSVPFTETSIPLVAAYQDSMRRYQRGKELHQWGLEAWIMGQQLQDALEQMGPAPTRAGFMDYLLSLRESNVHGLMTPSIQWVPNDPPFDAPTVADCIGMSRWDDNAGGWVAATPFPYCIPDAKQFFTDVAEQGT